MSSIITRFAPSPTGLLHAGNYRTALFCYLFSKKQGGEFALRIEDTDKNRSKPEYAENIIEALEWLGLSYTSTVIQSERVEDHQKALEQLIASGHAYISKEEVKKEGDREEVIRFKNPNKKVTFTDLIRGDITTDTTDLGDFVIARSMTEPVFHLAVVCDDAFMGVTHVVRGEDHISNTPRHILIQEALGLPTPTYAHLPMVLAKDRSKLSKRKGALPITEYKHQGYLPGAIVNYMALLGWNPGTDQEIFTFDELIQAFDLAKVQKSGAIFDDVKLEWINKEHLNLLSAEDFKAGLANYIAEYVDARHAEDIAKAGLDNIISVTRERMTHYGSIKESLSNGELDFIFSSPEFNTESVTSLIPGEKMRKNGVGEKVEVTPETTKAILTQVASILETVDEANWNKDSIKEALWPFAEHEGRGIVLWPTRVALSGREKSPDPFTIAEIIGKEQSITRLTKAADLL